jgi:hypothetical protein
LPICLVLAAFCCIPEAESRKINRLVLIFFRLARPRARGTGAAGSRRDIPAIPLAARAASPNPKRRVLTLQAYRRNPQGVLALVRRKRWLFRPLLAQVLPPRAKIDPAERLGIRVPSLHDAADFQRAMQVVWAAVSAGEIAIGEAGRIARQVRARIRALRRLARVQRRLARLANKTGPAPRPLG